LYKRQALEVALRLLAGLALRRDTARAVV
jgi:hypothetical protein